MEAIVTAVLLIAIIGWMFYSISDHGSMTKATRDVTRSLTKMEQQTDQILKGDGHRV